MSIWLTYNDGQTKKIKLFKGLKAFFAGIPAILALSPAFGLCVGKFNAKLVQILSMGETKDESRTGKTLTKTTFESNLIGKMIRLVALVRNFARSIGSQEILEFCKLTKSDLEDLTDALLLSKAREFRTILNANVEALADFLITPEAVTDFGAMVETYETLQGMTESSLSKSSASTQLLKQYFKEEDAIIKELDDFMFGISEEHPVEYAQYQEVRKLDDLPVSEEEEEEEPAPSNPEVPAVPNP